MGRGCKVCAGSVSPQHCRAHGVELGAKEVGQQAEFGIEACDAFGNPTDALAVDFDVAVTLIGPSHELL